VTAISLRGLTRRFPGGERPALAGLDLDVEPGELLVLVGPSGCGKSTALRLIAGLDAPDAGAVSIGGRDVGRVPPQDRDVAMVFQGYALYPHMSAREIMAFPLKMRGVPAAERARRVEEAAATLGLARLLDRRPGELSGGERQRCAFARALVTEPACVLADEPTGNLDSHTADEVFDAMLRLSDSRGTAFVIVTHDSGLAARAGRVLELRDGLLHAA